MSDNAIVRTDGIRKSFNGVAAVDNVSLEVDDGEFVTLLGPSGCGKTTLLRMIAGLEFPDTGRVFISGADVTARPAHKRPVNLVFQRVTLFPHLSVHENVAFGLRLKRVAKDEAARRVQAALETVRLPGFEHRDVQTLSGGEAQRIALARAIVNRPKVLLFDEPLSALDLQIRRQLQIELRDIHKQIGGTFIYVTHDQEEAMTLSDRVVVMNKGQVVQIGSPEEVYKRPLSVFTASFVGESNLWPATIVGREGRDAVVEVAGATMQVADANGFAPGSNVWLLVRPESVQIERPPAEAEGTGLRGTVEDVRFVGSVFHYRIAIAGHELKAAGAPSGAPALREGEEVCVSWRPSDARLLGG